MAVTLKEKDAQQWLQRHGVKNVKAVMDGIDFTKWVGTDWLDEGTKLAQYRDGSSVTHPGGALGGQWFALESHTGTVGTLGIGQGLAGRTRYVLTVVRRVEVLESTAKSMNKPGQMLYDRYIGPGGATQIFIPDGGLSSLG